MNPWTIIGWAIVGSMAVSVLLWMIYGLAVWGDTRRRKRRRRA